MPSGKSIERNIFSWHMLDCTPVILHQTRSKEGKASWTISTVPNCDPSRSPSSTGATYRDFTEKGGWVGPHNCNHLQHNPDVQPQEDVFYLAYFNAGLRVYNVANPRLPVEMGFFLPPDPRQRYGPMPQGRLVTQTEDVLVDRRGFIYITDKNQGLWILRYMGDVPQSSP